MTLNEYQKQAHKYAIYKGQLYPFLALASEVGEVLGKVSKLTMRDHNYYVDALSEENRIDLLRELGDCQWDLAEAAGVLGATLQDITDMNLNKLADRKARGKLGGSGDNR